MTIKFRAKTLPGWEVDSPLKGLLFPDGAAHVSGADTATKFSYQIAQVQGMSHDDLFTLAMWAKVAQERGEQTALVLPYLPGARMDRGIPTGAKVYADFLGEFVNPDVTITLDPHSDLALSYFDGALRNLSIFPVERIIRREIQDPSSDERAQPYVGVIAPDAGAVDRASRAAKVMGVPVYQAEKKRDFATGKLSGFGMKDELPSEGKLLIVDDICDGGGTFLGLADALDLPRERLSLWVSHGIFSGKANLLTQRFGAIHTTDSHTGARREDVGAHIIPIAPYLRTI